MGRAVSFLFIGMLWILAHQAAEANPPRKCPVIGIENGKVRIKSRGRVAKFKCRKGYTMFEGDKFATCVKGRWNGKIPKCITTGCDYYSSIPNGEAVYLYNEALVQFICNPGYVLEGSSALTCDGFGWNDTIPECKAPTDVEYFCDFESSSICGWSNGEHDEFDWTRNRGPSASFAVGTGPKADHTLGTIFGHYMYIEGSEPRSDGDRARLYSPVYPASFTESPTCFAFYYHMFGNTTGHLNIYMKGEEDNIEFQSPVYQMGGYNHDKWILQVVHLHQLDSNFQLVLEGVRGHSYTSDIGIDDVKLANGEDCDHLDEEAQKQYQTSAPETTRTTSPLPETTLEAESSTISSGGTESTAIISSSTDMSNDILVMGGSSAGTTESSTGSVSSTAVETSAAFQTSGGYKLESSNTPGPISSTTTTLRPITTAYSAFDPASDDDLSSCRNRCDEIAIDPGTCGCDIECAHNHTCCLDVEEFCEGYIITMPPPSPEPVATSTSPSVTNAVDSTVEPTSAVTEPQSSTSKAPVMIITTVPATPEVTSTISTTLEITTREVTTPEVTTTTESSTALEPLVTEMPTTSTSTEQTQTPLVTTDTSTKTTQQTTKSKPIVPKTPPPTTTLEPTTETTTETTTESTTESTTVVTKTPSTTTTRATKSIEIFTSAVMQSTKEPSTSSAPYSLQPGISGNSSTPSKGSNAATSAIVISTVIIIIIIVAVLVIAYIRKRRRDKLPEDSDIQFLARDEIMMDGNIFSLSGTITQARNSAI